MDMKIKNNELVDIYRTYQEISGCQKAKEEMSESGKVIYAIVKSLSLLEPNFKALVEKETTLRSAAKSASPENEKSVMEELTKDLTALFLEEQEVSIHQISMQNAEILAKYLTGPATITLFRFLTLDANVKQFPKEVKKVKA